MACVGHGAAMALFEMFSAGRQESSIVPKRLGAYTHRLKEPVHGTGAVCCNRGHCPVLIYTLKKLNWATFPAQQPNTEAFHVETAR